MNPVLASRTRGRKKDPELRRRILQVAQLFFARRGFEDVAMDEIAREAGTTKTTLYSHFRGKEDLFRAALDDLLARLPPASDLARSGADGPMHAQLMAIAERVHGLLSSLTFDLVRRTLASNISAPLRERIWNLAGRPYFDAIHDVLRAHAERGALRLDDTRSAASLFIAVIAGGKALHSQLSGSSFGFIEDDHLREGVSMFLKAHAPSPAEARA